MSWFERGDTRIYYEEHGQGDPLLLTPGWGGSIDELSAIRDALTAHYHVIAADLPGSGKSGPQPRTYTSSYLKDDAATLAAMLPEVAGAPAHLVGFSDGGEYSLILAETNPELVRSLALWGAAGQLKAPPEMFDAMEHMVDSPIPPMQEFSNRIKSLYGADNARIMTKSFANALRDINASGGDLSFSRAGEIRCPTLLITGEHDFLAPPAAVSALADRIPGAEFIEAKGAGHNVHESHGEWLAGTIVPWLQQH